uniref:Uncharacterized protein n=1 Tax=Salix viminalis TaxID=40686 RepID=A0A6N2LIE3_SALVM
MKQGNAVVVDAGKNDLATRLRATIAQKQMENEMGQTNGGGDLFSLMMVFDEKLPPENLFPLQKLISIFHQRPEQKIVFITQHGLLPLMELLEVPKTRLVDIANVHCLPWNTYPEVSGHGRENGNLDSMPRISHKTVGKKVGAIAPNEGAASTSGIVSQTASGVLSGSGSATSSGLLSQMVSAEVAREYLEKVADLLLEFSQADTSVKSYMCSQSLLNRLFQMFNRIELPILLKILKCIDNLSTDPNCLENLQRADAITYLIPNLELKDGPLVDHIHSELLFSMLKAAFERDGQSSGGQVLVKQMATSLLKALHINTVL